jgi:hypothetical protein
VVQISSDPFTNPSSQHRAQVEPDSFAFGSTIVAAFQSGRFVDGGSSGIGFATSGDAGRTWTAGFLPSLTVFSQPAGTFDRASDPTVAFDAAHGTWLIAILALREIPGDFASSLVVSRSADGRVWTPPTYASGPAAAFAHDKEWLACDNGVTSPYSGRCYLSYTAVDHGSAIATQHSDDGGVTWSVPVQAAGAAGDGTQPVVQPNGTLVIPFATSSGAMASIRSVDGGTTFSSAVTIASVSAHDPTALRAPPLPSAAVDATGRIFVTWHDCRFHAGCSPPTPSAPNDVVLSTSSDGVTWAAPTKVPISDGSTSADRFLPVLAADPATSGSSTRLALTYYDLADWTCPEASCTVRSGIVSSADAGATWTPPVQLAPAPFAVDWLPTTTQGRMLGDYFGLGFAGGDAVVSLALAGPATTGFAEAMYGGAPFAAAGAATPPPPAAPPSAPPPPPAPPRAAARRCVVPNVRRLTLARAERAIRRANCRVGRVARRRSRAVRRGRVLAQAPRPGTRLAARARVNLVVSRGRR